MSRSRASRSSRLPRSSRATKIRARRFLLGALYGGNIPSERRVQYVLRFMHAAARGDGQLMVDTQLTMRKEEQPGSNAQTPEPIYGRFSLGQNLSVYCSEKEPLESTDDFRRASAESEIMRSLLKGFIENPSGRCSLWPSGRADRIESTHVYYDGPQLVFTGELYASGSGNDGYKLEMLYPNARNLVFRNGFHGQFHPELPNAADADSADRDYWNCALRLGHQFLADPQRKLDTSCAETRQLRLVR